MISTPANEAFLLGSVRGDVTGSCANAKVDAEGLAGFVKGSDGNGNWFFLCDDIRPDDCRWNVDDVEECADGARAD